MQNIFLTDENVLAVIRKFADRSRYHPNDERSFLAIIPGEREES